MTQNRIEETFLILTKTDGKRLLVRTGDLDRTHEKDSGCSIAQPSGGADVTENFDSIVTSLKAAGHIVKDPA